jgi:hypothetical protein
MDKVTKKLNETVKMAEKSAPAQNKRQAISDAHHAVVELNAQKAGTGMLADDQVADVLLKGTKTMLEQSASYRKAFTEMVALQIDIMDKSKTLTQKSKDYANQVGEALARIDKVLVKDFENKLGLLERFVIAMTALAELEKNGYLAKISSSFKGQ